MKVAFIYGKQPSATLTRVFTRSSCYHVGFTDGMFFWDMHLIRRRRLWPQYAAGRKVLLADCPAPVTRDYLEHQLSTDASTYGKADYALFALRPFFHLVGASTRNAGGIICSEMVANDLAACGWSVRFKEVPSPADLEVALLGRRNAFAAPRRAEELSI